MYKEVHEIENTAIGSLVDIFGGENALICAAFNHSYFICPDAVQNKTPYYPDRARYSREHYPNKKKNDQAVWKGDGREVTLDDNRWAQTAWEKYTDHPIKRKSGYGIRHIWGNPSNPDAFTAGWNLCYMPFWAGMLTEEQHPFPKLKNAFRQASWNLYFSKTPVCTAPDFVKNPGINLDEILQGQPILILSPARKKETPNPVPFDSLEEAVRAIRTKTNQSWSNLYKAVRMLQGKPHELFGTKNVETSSKSTIRRILKAAGYDCCPKNLAKLESLIAQRMA